MSCTQNRSSTSPLKAALVTLSALVSLALPRVAFASVGAGAGLPYEDTFAKIVTSLTGPWAFTVAVLCVIVFAYRSIERGGDLGGSTMAFLGPAFICTLLLGAKKMMSFFGQGAMLSPATSSLAQPSAASIAEFASGLVIGGVTLLLFIRLRRRRQQAGNSQAGSLES